MLTKKRENGMQRGLCVVGSAALLLTGCSTGTERSAASDAPAAAAVRDSGAAQSLGTPFGGMPRWGYSTPAPPPPLATPGNIEAALLPADAVSGIVGGTVAFPKTADAPPAPIVLTAAPECSALLGLNATSYGDAEKHGHAYTSYRSSRLQDSPDKPNLVVVQEVAVYPDAAKAATIFEGAFNDEVRGCNGATVQTADGDDQTDWQLQVGKIADARAQWRAMRLIDGERDDWTCAHNAQTKNNVMLTATVCKHDGGGVVATAEIAKRIAAAVPD